MPNFELMRLDQMDQQSKMKMVAKHLISPELIKQPAAAVLVNDDESLSVMINEEDHIRIQAMELTRHYRLYIIKLHQLMMN